MSIIIFSIKRIWFKILQNGLSNLLNFDITGIKLDEICTPNPFLTLPMARSGLKWPFKGHSRPVKNHVDHHIFQMWSWNGLRNELLAYRRHESAQKNATNPAMIVVCPGTWVKKSKITIFMIMLIIIFFSWVLHSIGNVLLLDRTCGRGHAEHEVLQVLGRAHAQLAFLGHGEAAASLQPLLPSIRGGSQWNAVISWKIWWSTWS